MRSWIFAALAAVLVTLIVPAPASALEDCWPQCVFTNGTSTETAARWTEARREGSTSQFRRTARATAQKPTGRKASTSRTASRASRAVVAEQRAERRSRAREASAYVGGGAQVGIASYYWQPQRVASGGWFNPNALTAAHKTLPFGTRVRVTHLGNGRSVNVVINDRGPFVRGRIIDLSKAAAGVIGMQGQGIANVRLEVVGR